MDGLDDIPWSRLGAGGWSFIACSLTLILIGAWRLSRGDANISPSVEPRSARGPHHPMLGALGVAAFAAVFSYLYSGPWWLTRSVQQVLLWLRADNRGSFQLEQDELRFCVSLAAQLLAVGTLLALMRAIPGIAHIRPDGSDRERLIIDRRGLLRLGGLFAACAALLCLGTLAWTAFASLAESQGQFFPREVQPLVTQIAHWHGPTWLLGVLFVSVTVGAPLLEEIGFRAILYPALREALPRGWSIALTGLIFGMMHGNLAALIPISLMGAWLCIVRDRFGIGTCILVHALSNAWTVLWLVIAPEVAGRL